MGRILVEYISLCSGKKNPAYVNRRPVKIFTCPYFVLDQPRTHILSYFRSILILSSHLRCFYKDSISQRHSIYKFYKQFGVVQ
jgi:hypothetical protein